jgi:hypothetical protein
VCLHPEKNFVGTFGVAQEGTVGRLIVGIDGDGAVSAYRFGSLSHVSSPCRWPLVRMRHREGNVLKDQAYDERLGASPLNPVECGFRVGRPLNRPNGATIPKTSWSSPSTVHRKDDKGCKDGPRLWLAFGDSSVLHPRCMLHSMATRWGHHPPASHGPPLCALRIAGRPGGVASCSRRVREAFPVQGVWEA